MPGRTLVSLTQYCVRMMTVNEPYRLKPIFDRESQALGLGCMNGPYRPEINQAFGLGCMNGPYRREINTRFRFDEQITSAAPETPPDPESPPWSVSWLHLPASPTFLAGARR